VKKVHNFSFPRLFALPSAVCALFALCALSFAYCALLYPYRCGFFTAAAASAMICSTLAAVYSLVSHPRAPP
jgi:hypothetical protein